MKNSVDQDTRALFRDLYPELVEEEHWLPPAEIAETKHEHSPWLTHLERMASLIARFIR